MKLVSTLTEDFLPGLKVLSHSLAANGGLSGLEWIILPQEWTPTMKSLSFLLENGMYPVVMRMEDIGGASFPSLFPPTRPRLVKNWQRLRAFLLPPEDEYVLIDVDQICF